MTCTHTLGFPRIGAHRELKFALEAYWRGDIDETQLRATGAELRLRHWQLQRDAGMTRVSVGDFAWYDHVHQATALFGASPCRFGLHGAIDLRAYFDLARGTPQQAALAMTKWFDTNYHYLVPELSRETCFRLNGDWLFPEVQEALAAGHAVKICLLGPLSYLYLSRCARGGEFDRLELLSLLLNSYWSALRRLAELGVDWVQIDEPVLALNLPDAWLRAYKACYRELAEAGPKLLLASYFGDVSAHLPWLRELPLAGLHLDLVRAPQQLDAAVSLWPADRVLSAGIIDGRNIWRNDLRSSLRRLQPLAERYGERLWLAPSCSLLHVPVSLDGEDALDPELRSWLAFATEKLSELRVLATALDQGVSSVQAALDASDAAVARRTSLRLHDPQLRTRLAAMGSAEECRSAEFTRRRALQQTRLQLPAFPTTTIGSFPQTAEIRQLRARHRDGQLTDADYERAMQSEIADAVTRQERLGLDVLVHGEAERNDMVEYFGEQLCGYAFTRNGWVQSYGSRCVKPPLLYGEVSRRQPMTVHWARYAQSLTRKPVKGMLTGPITMLQWSFVRDDQPRADTARQLALAIRDEVLELEAAGIAIIQIDEPALREGLPLREQDRAAYLDWAVRAFRLASGGVRDDTQIHTHMCYAEFRDILPQIAALDADVITIETSRSAMALLDAFGDFRYPNDIGPGVYDIHSPRLPATEDMIHLLERAASLIPPERLWVNPDCGLKTRGWTETERALGRMVDAARVMRQRHPSPA